MRGMTLDEYLSQDGAESTVALAARLTANPDQVRQWRYSHGGRLPSPAKCVDLERVTGGQVSRRDMRPDDWHRIWPELITHDHPALSEPAEAGRG